MEENEIFMLWKAQDKKLEESLVLNRRNTADITRMKVRHFVSSMRPIKIFTLLVGFIWVGLGAIVLTNLFVHAFSQISLFFLFSASIQVLLTAIALVFYIYQLVLMHQVDISEAIVATQEKIAKLQSSTIWVTRILLLQLPVWTTFYLSSEIFKNGNVVLLLIQFLVTAAFTYLAIWLFVNIKTENREKKWFQMIFNGGEWNPLIKSMMLLEQIKEAKSESDGQVI